MKGKSVLITIGFLLFFGGIIYFLWFYRGAKYIGDETVVANAIPDNSPAFVRINDAQNLLSLVSSNEKNPMAKELFSTPIFSPLKQQLLSFKNILNQNPELEDLFIGKTVYIASDVIGKNTIEFIFIIELKRVDEEHLILKLIKNHLNGVQTKKYLETPIFQAHSSEKTKFHYAVKNGLFLASAGSLLVENSLRRIISKEQLYSVDFEELYSTIRKDAPVNIFINNQTFPSLVRNYADPVTGKIVDNFSITQWSQLDATSTDNMIFFNGFSVYKSPDDYFFVLSSQEPQETSIVEMIPDDVAFFFQLNISNSTEYRDDLQRYWTLHHKWNKRGGELKEYEHLTKTDISSLFFDHFDGEIAMVETGTRKYGNPANRFVVSRVKSERAAREDWENMMEKYVKKNTLKYKDWVHEDKIDAQTSFSFYKVPFPNLFNNIISPTGTFPAVEYFAFWDNYMVFGNNKKAISKYLYDCLVQKTLKNDLSFQHFYKQFSEKHTAFMYMNLYKQSDFLERNINANWKKLMGNSIDALKKFDKFGWELRANDASMMYNTLGLNYRQVEKEKTKTIWKTPTQTLVQTKPQFCLNHKDPTQKEIILQNANNELLLINATGRILWKVPIEKPIMGSIHQIDYYRNNKLQYLFNTEDKIYIVDRLGNNVAKYPIKLRSKATAGLTVKDYDNNSNYRIFIPAADKKLYLYDKTGKTVKGWSFPKTESTVKSPIQHVQHKGKDYIYFTDDHRLYVLNRRGGTRIDIRKVFDIAINSSPYFDAKKSAFVFSENTGKVNFIDTEGTHNAISVDDPVAKTAHFFAYEDMNGDGQSDFIFAAGKRLLLQGSNNKKIFSFDFEGEISSPPNIYRFSKTDKRIGVTVEDKNRIYLFNKNGTLYHDFPLQGCTPFSIGWLKRSVAGFNLTVGTPDGYLNNYRIK